MVVSNKGFPLMTVFGSAVRVDFPADYIWETHKRFPGLVKILVHSHPNGMPTMSEEDRTTLKAWTYAFSPHPIYMEVVSSMGDWVSRRRYHYKLESLKSWQDRGKQGTRQVALHEADISDVYENWIRTLMVYTNKLEE